MGYSVYGTRWLGSGCQAAPGQAVSCLPNPRINGQGIIERETLDLVFYRIIYADYGSNVTAMGGAYFWQYGRSQTVVNLDGECYVRVNEWGKKFVLQGIELVDWDTGEVYASTNSSSLTFQAYRNTIVRFKYVKTESWSREWIIVPPPPAPPEPEDCAEIINSYQPGTPRWCECARVLGLPEADQICREKYCLTVSVRPCCKFAPTYNDCLESWSSRGDRECVRLAEGQTATVEVYWSASWRLKPGWRFDGALPAQQGAYCPTVASTHDSVNGYCRATLPPSTYYDIVVLFEKTS